jgi:uncharacterized protein
MDVTPLVKQDAQIIQSYEGGQFRVSGQTFDGAVIVYPAHTRQWHVGTAFDALDYEDFRPLIDAARDLDVVLLGCGRKMAMPPAKLKRDLRGASLSIEPMDTGAACRTFNILIAEGRRVAAAMLPFV